MNKGLIVGGMPDTVEYYTLFHLALKQGGWFELLIAMFTVIIEMVSMDLQLKKLDMYLNRNK